MRGAIIALALLAQTIGGVRPGSNGPVAITTTDAGTCVKNSAACAVQAIGGYTHVSVEVSNVWTGTLSFECSVSGAATATKWVALSLAPPSGGAGVTTTTANGTWQGQCMGAWWRVRGSASMTGTATVLQLATLPPTPRP